MRLSNISQHILRFRRMRWRSSEGIHVCIPVPLILQYHYSSSTKVFAGIMNLRVIVSCHTEIRPCPYGACIIHQYQSLLPPAFNQKPSMPCQFKYSSRYSLDVMKVPASIKYSGNAFQIATILFVKQFFLNPSLHALALNLS